MLVSIVVTCQDQKEANKIAQVLLSKKLIVCANSWPVNSRYWWKGKIQRDKEMILVCKGLNKNIIEIKKEITRIHSYKLPVITVEKIDTDSDVLRWVKQVIK